ncbi:MAG: hypothetical protein P8J87_21430 [Verrucomicrobiales bacterium]|nr:hypothetical protein [Verrucomicrobiales bacterium]
MSLILKAVASRLTAEGIDWATLDHLEIDKSNKEVHATVTLEGEPEPVSVTATYSLGADTLQLLTASSTKPWLSKALTFGIKKHGGQIPLPTGMQGSMLRMML